MSENNILAVILAGGQSKRMGEDKVMLKINDITLIEPTKSQYYPFQLYELTILQKSKI